MTEAFLSPQRVRFAAAGLLIAAALLYPIERPPFGHVMYQIWCGMGLASAALLLGFARVPLRWTVGWLALCALIAARAGPYPDKAAEGIAYVTAMYVALSLGMRARDPARLHTLLLAVLAAAVVNSLEGLLQYLGLARDLYPWVPEVPRRGMAFGVFRQPNPFATFLCLGTVTSAWLLHRRCLTRGMAWMLAGILAAGVAASASRIGALGVLLLMLAGLFGGGRIERDSRMLLVGQAVLYIAFALLMPVLAQLHGFDAGSVGGRMARVAADSRWVLWSNALQILLERPWWGWGWHEFVFAHYTVPMSPRFGGESELLDHAHNLVLHLATELGVSAAVTILGAAFAAFVLHLRHAALRGDIVFALLGIALIGQHSMVEYPLWTISLAFIAAALLGTCVASDPSTQLGQPGAWARWGVPLVCFALIAFALESHRQYARITRVYEIPMRWEAAKAHALREAADNWLFRGTVDYMMLGRMHPSAANANEVKVLALRVLHISPEPVVVAKLVESAWLGGDLDTFQHHLPRFRVAYPIYFGNWRDGLAAAQPGLAAWLRQHPEGAAALPAAR